MSVPRASRASSSTTHQHKDAADRCLAINCALVQTDAASGIDSAHTFGRDCPECGDGRSGTRCDLSGYNAKRVRFILAHRESYAAAYLNPGRAAASHEMQRLEAEYRTMPPRHSCSCWPTHCSECLRLAKQREAGGCTRHGKGYVFDCQQCNLSEFGVELGRTSPVNPAMPNPVMLDLERAFAVVGDQDDAEALSRYMSLDGAATDAQTRRPAARSHRRPSTIIEMVCLMCARPAAPGQRQCQRCGGSLVAEEALAS